MNGCVLYLEVELFIPYAQSLKQKRSVIKSLKSVLSSQFKMSVAEVGHQDAWQRSVLAMALVGAQAEALKPMIEGVLNLLQERFDGELIRYEHAFL